MTEQYYLRARYYNPLLGRFLQEDMYRGDGLNLYAYCGNNPVRYCDSSGYNSQPLGCENGKNQVNEDTGGNEGNSGVDGIKPGEPNESGGFSRRGYNPQPGERTLEGFVSNNVSIDKEIGLNTNSSGFNNNNGNVGGNLRDLGQILMLR